MSLIVVLAIACDEQPARDVPAVALAARAIIATHCVACHSAGGIGPERLDTWAAASRHADTIAFVTERRLMPPWSVDGSGACGDIADAGTLSDAEIAALVAWARAGAPSWNPGEIGEGHDPVLAPPVAPDLRVDATVAMPVDYRPRPPDPASDVDDHRCFRLAPEHGTPTGFVTAFRVRPGDPRVVHHAVLFTVPGVAGGGALDTLEAADAAPGYACVAGGAIVPGARPIAAWAPGQPTTRLPAGTGVRVAATDHLVLQVHYNTTAGEGPDRTAVDLELAAEVPDEAIFLALDDEAMVLEPGLAAATTTVERRPIDVGLDEPLTIYGVYPHMHLRGRSVSLSVVRAGNDAATCLVDVPRWDFHWQRMWFFGAPIIVMPDDKLRLTCTFDTRGETEPLGWGFSTDDEMCIAGLYARRGLPSGTPPPSSTTNR